MASCILLKERLRGKSNRKIEQYFTTEPLQGRYLSARCLSAHWHWHKQVTDDATLTYPVAPDNMYPKPPIRLLINSEMI